MVPRMRVQRSVPIIVSSVLLLGACSTTSTTPGTTAPLPTSEATVTSTPVADAPDATTPATEPSTTELTPITEPAPTENADPVEIDELVAALGLAAQTVNGPPFAVEYDRDDDGDSWEISLATDAGGFTVRVSADGTEVLSQEQDGDVDDDEIELLQAIEIDAVGVLEIVAPQFSGRVDEMQLDARDGDIVWEIEIRRADDTSFDVVVDAVTGAIVSADEGRGGTASPSSDLDGYVEYETILREIPDVAGLDAIVETDNPNSRVILFGASDGRTQYKSVFVKQQRRLELIDLDGNGKIFDGVLP